MENVVRCCYTNVMMSSVEKRLEVTSLPHLTLMCKNSFGAWTRTMNGKVNSLHETSFLNEVLNKHTISQQTLHFIQLVYEYLNSS